MRSVARLSLIVLLLLGAARAGLFLAYAWWTIGSPLEAFHLESKMVHLAWRVQHGLVLYPDWRDGPYVANFFGPVYFVVVGAAGRMVSVDLPQLYLIGRGLTFLGVLMTAALVGIVTARRSGVFAGVMGAVLSLGVAPLFGYGVMARADALADFLGLLGFVLATGRRRRAIAVGGFTLILAVFTKQTTGVYLAAAVLAHGIAGRRRAAAGLVGGVGGGVLGIVGLVTWAVEPRFASDLMGERFAPWKWVAWWHVARRVLLYAPDWLILAAVGVAGWARRARAESVPLALTVTLVGFSVVTIAKRGADLNYLLGWRAIAGLAAGDLWRTARERGPGEWRRCLGAALAAGAVGSATVPGLIFAWFNAEAARETAGFLRTPAGEAYLATLGRLSRVAQDPGGSLLTDFGFLDIRRRERTLFGDPWLFRLLAERGRIDPGRLERDVERGRFELIATTRDLFDPGYEAYDFGLPVPVARRARAAYEPVGSALGLFVYGRRGAAGRPARTGRR